MIKFFRRLRQNLISENRFRKYMLYAIGEIVLVVIGILLALQINNWNQQKNNEDKLISLLKEHQEELKLNKRDIDGEIRRSENYIKRNRALLSNKQLEDIPIDTLEKHLETFYVKIGFNTKVNERFKNLQITDFGRFDSIILSMQDYYGFIIPAFNSSTTSHNKAVDKADEYWRYEQEQFEFNYSEDENSLIQNPSKRKEELIKLLKSPKARNMLKIDNRKKSELIFQMKDWKEWAKTEIEYIDKILVEDP